MEGPRKKKETRSHFAISKFKVLDISITDRFPYSTRRKGHVAVSRSFRRQPQGESIGCYKSCGFFLSLGAVIFINELQVLCRDSGECCLKLDMD